MDVGRRLARSRYSPSLVWFCQIDLECGKRVSLQLNKTGPNL